MRYNDAEEKIFDLQLEKNYKGEFKHQNYSSKLSYLDPLTITTTKNGRRKMTIKEWMEVDPDALYTHVYLKRKAFIANSIFTKLKGLISKKTLSKIPLYRDEKDKKSLHEATLRKFNAEKNNNVLGTSKSRFRSLGKREKAD